MDWQAENWSTIDGGGALKLIVHPALRSAMTVDIYYPVFTLLPQILR